MSFLNSLGSGLKTVGKGILDVLTVAGPSVAGAAATSLGGPLAGAVAQSLVNSVIQVEALHNASGITGTGAQKKQQVIDQFTAFMPVIEALAAAAGHPIADKVAFEAALPTAIDATVNGFNSYAAIIRALNPPVAPAIPAASAGTTIAAASISSVGANPLSILQPKAA